MVAAEPLAQIGEGGGVAAARRRGPVPLLPVPGAEVVRGPHRSRGTHVAPPGPPVAQVVLHVRHAADRLGDVLGPPPGVAPVDRAGQRHLAALDPDLDVRGVDVPVVRQPVADLLADPLVAPRRPPRPEATPVASGLTAGRPPPPARLPIAVGEPRDHPADPPPRRGGVPLARRRTLPVPRPPAADRRRLLAPERLALPAALPAPAHHLAVHDRADLPDRPRPRLSIWTDRTPRQARSAPAPDPPLPRCIPPGRRLPAALHGQPAHPAEPLILPTDQLVPLAAAPASYTGRGKS